MEDYQIFCIVLVIFIIVFVCLYLLACSFDRSGNHAADFCMVCV